MKILHFNIPLVLLLSLNLCARGPANGKEEKKPVPDSIKTRLAGCWKGIAIKEGAKRDVEIIISTKADGELAIIWTIEQTGVFRRPVYSIAWNSEKKSLVLDDGFFELQYDGQTPRQLQAVINGHGLIVKFRLNASRPATLPYILKDVSFQNGDVKLAGTMSIPGSKGKMPAIIFLHGSGYSDRWDWAPYFANILSEMGIVCLFFDKRGCGESTGNWITSSLDDLSSDANKAMEFLQTQEHIDRTRIGFWGESQSGWVAPNCLATNDQVAFMVICCGGADSPREIELFGYKNLLLGNGMKQPQVDSAFLLVNGYFDYLEAKKSLVEIKEDIQKVKNTSWYKYIGLDRILPSEKNRKNWSWVAAYDPLLSIRKINFPLLLIFGGKDVQTNTRVAVEKWKLALSAGALTKSTIKVFENASHGIKLGEHTAASPLFWQEFAPGYIDLVKRWANKNILRKK